MGAGIIDILEIKEDWNLEKRLSRFLDCKNEQLTIRVNDH